MSEISRRDDPDHGAAWKAWGPYVAARQWGTVREDYSADGDAWSYLPFEQAHARAYRWGEDGLAAICDRWQLLCFGLALWNGHDPILKERPFGLTNGQGNHGEDAKDYWWVLDDTPTHSHMKFLYRYPQAEFPYQQLREANAARGKNEREFELSDTGVLADNRFFDVTVTYAKAAPDDICIVIEAANHGPDPAPLHVLPTVWFRNTWAWGRDDRHPWLYADNGAIRCEHETLGTWWLAAEGGPDLLVTQNETNARALFGSGENPAPFTKDGIGEHVIRRERRRPATSTVPAEEGAGQDGSSTVDSSGRGTKAAAWYRFDAIEPGATATVRLRLSTSAPGADTFGPEFDATIQNRRSEADDFYAAVLPGADPAEAAVARRAFAGLLWGCKVYRYDVPQWLEGDPAQPAPPASRRARGARNVGWPHVEVAEIMSLPDEWEYPWFAAWDLAFHTIALAHVDPRLAKDQLGLLCREWLTHPAGQLPAYEWNFGDVNPPVHAWAAFRVYQIDARRTGKPDREFLERIFHKQLLTFSWWVNAKDPDSSFLFEGGFLGMDNVGPFNRSDPPPGWKLEQSDATSWMAIFCLSMLDIALELARADHAYEDAATKFFEHFLAIAGAAAQFGSTGHGLWDELDGFCYDLLSRERPDGGIDAVPLRVRSMTGLLPVAAVALIPAWVWTELPGFTARVRWLVRRHPERTAHAYLDDMPGEDDPLLLSLLDPGRLRRVLARLLDPGEFLSPGGIRSLSAAHRDGTEIVVDGTSLWIDYEPAESTSGLFGGNSNWRGPIWFPVNILLIEALYTYSYFHSADLTVPFPADGDEHCPLDRVARELAQRLIGLFLPGPDGARALGTPHDYGDGPLWTDHPTFNEYFHGDTGEGLGASHQTGWTGLVASLVAIKSITDS